MENAVFASIRKNMIYDTNRSPLDNIESFFTAVKAPQYEQISVESEVEGKVRYVLGSAWKNEAGLQKITNSFFEVFTEEMINRSMITKFAEEYAETLKDCKRKTHQINLHFMPSFGRWTIIRRHPESRDKDVMLAPDDLPEEQRLLIERCYELIRTLWLQLEEFINEEIKENERREYVRTNSDYIWEGDKNDISELARALYETGSLKRGGGKKMMASTFARDLAAFLGQKTSFFHQDIELLYSKPSEQRGGFLLKCHKALIFYYDNKHGQSKKPPKSD